MNNYSKWEDFLHADLNEWHNTIMGEIFTHRQEKNRPELPLLSVTGENGVVDRDTLERRDTSNADKSKYLRVAPGDIVYNTMRMWQGVSGSAPKDGLVSPAYTVLEPKKSITSAFAKYLVKEERLVQVFHKNSQGLVDDTLNLKFANFSPIQVKIPPLPEQKKIASILTSVDEVIEKTQSQIKKLKDLKKGTMNELLTKGIGHTEFKDSKLGRIPKSWRVLTIGELGEFKNGINKPKEAFGSGTKFVNISDAYSVNLDCKSLKRVKVKPQEIIDYKLEMSDLVFVRSSVKLEGVAIPTIFKSYEESVIFCGFMIRFRSRSEEVVPEYLREYLLTDKPRILMQRVATGGANININQEALSVFKVMLPTKDEQKYIIKKTKSANIQIAKLTLKHAKFQSLKKSLMQDLLTGKVRVKLN